MLTTSILFVSTLLFYKQYGCHASGLTSADVHSSNFTKRPLNLYITANGKHATVQRKVADLNACDDKNSCKALKLAYAESVPPFLIKTRGSALIIYDSNSDRASQWHLHGRPSIVQMLAASGHRTVAVGLEHLWKQSTTMKNLVDSLNLTRIVLVLPAMAYTDFDLLKSFVNSTRLDAVVMIEPGRAPPVIAKTVMISEKEHSGLSASPDVQEIVIQSPLSKGNQEKVMQIVANFLDFVHVR